MSLVEVPSLSNSIWPYETGKAPDTSPSDWFGKIRCFVLCPFNRAEIVLFLVKNAANYLKEFINLDVEVYFAGDFSGPGTIHPDIWVHIKQADLVIADLTGYNHNVMYELGVAAAWRPINSVIIIRDESDGMTHAFDLQPARQRLYDSRDIGWITKMRDWLVYDMELCLSVLPFRDEPVREISYPLIADFSDGKDNVELWSPGPGHRRLISQGLEFGSPFFFPYSWISPIGLRPRYVRVIAEMAFSDSIDENCWIGIALRAQSYMANNQHLTWLSSNGEISITGPGKDCLGKDEHLLTQLQSFNPSLEMFIPFDIFIDDKIWSIRVGSYTREIPLFDLPYVYSSGRIMFQSYRCRAIVKKIVIESIQ